MIFPAQNNISVYIRLFRSLETTTFQIRTETNESRRHEVFMYTLRSVPWGYPCSTLPICLTYNHDVVVRISH